MNKRWLSFFMMILLLTMMGCANPTGDQDPQGDTPSNGDSQTTQPTLNSLFHDVFVAQNNYTLVMTMDDGEETYEMRLLLIEEASYFEMTMDGEVAMSYYAVLEDGTWMTYMAYDEDQWFHFPSYDDDRDAGLMDFFDAVLQAAWFEETSSGVWALKASHYDDVFGDEADEVDGFTITFRSGGQVVWHIHGTDDDGEYRELNMTFSQFGSTSIQLPDFNLPDDGFPGNGQGTDPDDIAIIYPDATITVERYHLGSHILTVELEVVDVDLWISGDFRDLTVYFNAKLIETVGTTPIDVMIEIRLYNDADELIRTRTLIAYDLYLNELECCFYVYFGLDYNKSTSYRVVIETHQEG